MVEDRVKMAWSDLTFVETIKHEPPKTEREAHALHRMCFSSGNNYYQPSDAQKFFIAKMIRLGGYDGRLIVNGYGQFFQDVKDFYVAGLKIQYGD